MFKLRADNLTTDSKMITSCGCSLNYILAMDEENYIYVSSIHYDGKYTHAGGSVTSYTNHKQSELFENGKVSKGGGMYDYIFKSSDSKTLFHDKDKNIGQIHKNAVTSYKVAKVNEHDIELYDASLIHGELDTHAKSPIIMSKM